MSIPDPGANLFGAAQPVGSYNGLPVYGASVSSQTPVLATTANPAPALPVAQSAPGSQIVTTPDVFGAITPAAYPPPQQQLYSPTSLAAAGMPNAAPVVAPSTAAGAAALGLATTSGGSAGQSSAAQAALGGPTASGARPAALSAGQAALGRPAASAAYPGLSGSSLLGGGQDPYAALLGFDQNNAQRQQGA